MGGGGEIGDRTFEWKKILSLVRGGDYAHAGEEKAINKVFGSVPKRSEQLLLDVGCGLGGTADYVNKHGWGSVVGIDLDPELIEYAKKRYPEVEFHACDVTDISSVFDKRFDVIYLFNSFYSFTDQETALFAMKRVAVDDAKLLIFDYVDRGSYLSAPVICVHDVIPNPLILDNISTMLSRSGWGLTAIEDLTDDYERWYDTFVRKIDSKQQDIIDFGGDEAFDKVRGLYSDILDSIRCGSLCGALVSASLAK